MVDNRPNLVYAFSIWLTLHVNSFLSVFHNIPEHRCTGKVVDPKSRLFKYFARSTRANEFNTSYY